MRTLFNGYWLLLLGVALTPNVLFAQAELQAWGNIRGIRTPEQLLQFSSSLRWAQGNWSNEQFTAQEFYKNKYHREGPLQRVTTNMDSLFWRETVLDTGSGQAQVTIETELRDSMHEWNGLFFHIALSAENFSNPNIQVLAPPMVNLNTHPAPPVRSDEQMRIFANGISVSNTISQFRLLADRDMWIIVVRNPSTGELGLYFTLQSGFLSAGSRSQARFDITMTGTAVATPVNLRLFPDFPGAAFLGMGGNFRLQNRRNDPPVIDYCLKNMEVRMGRVEMPWRRWHPSDTLSPLDAARKGQLDPQVKAAMEMAQRLSRMKMPVLLAAWFPPAWAVEGELTSDPKHPDGTWGNPLRPDRMTAIYASIADYIVYLKEAYQVEVSMFSFNEADLGINVRQSPKQHADFIKGLGQHLRSRGLATRLLLGDTSDANAFGFVEAALNDPATWAYIGAVSFHSWRGWDDATLLKWQSIADRLNVPLIIGEGSIDAAAWSYPMILREPHYAMEEIKLYLRILALCQPQSILQWQLTSDYALLAGGGLFGDNSTPMQPTQRFFNLKQLALTPADLLHLPITHEEKDLFVAALGHSKRNNYAFHIVNDGPAREIIINDLPPKLKSLRVYTTDATHQCEKGERIAVINGQARVQVATACFVSLFSEQ
jgi:hypothetical protein